METETETPKSPFPLSIELILERVFRYLPRSSLETCRFVCRRWQKTANRIIKQRPGIQMQSNHEVELFLKTIRNHKLARLHKFQLQNLNFNSCEALIHLFEEMLPTLEILVIDKCTSSFENYHRVLRLVAPTLEKLDFSILKEVEGEKNIYYPLFPVYSNFETKTPMILPKLKQLDYICYSSSTSTLLSQVVVGCPNLISLAVGNLMSEDPPIFQNLRLPKLRHLSLNMLQVEGQLPIEPIGLQASHVRCLMNMRLELSSLTLLNVHPNVPETLLRDWLESLSPTLDCLNLRIMSSDPGLQEINYGLPYKYATNIPVPFPMKLPNLREALIYKPFIRNIVHVLTSCSNLSKLTLPFHCDANWNGIMPNNLRPHEALKSLELFWIPNNVFTKLVKSFINLTSLTLHDCNAKGLLDVVFTKLITLKYLVLESWYTDTSAITDEIMTGMLNGTETRTGSYIGNLRNLKTLSLNKGEFISKKSLQFGIMDLPELCFLALTIDQKDKVSEFESTLEDAGFEHVQLKTSDKCLDDYEYFLKHTEEFWENETSEEFILRHVRSCAEVITQVCI